MDNLREPDTEISFRAGTFESFYRRSLQMLSQQTIDGLKNPLRNVNLQRSDGIVQGFAAAWAAVGDILTFYQERTINEGFLRTAREEFSIRQLIATIGYRCKPALSARTTLAATLTPKAGTVDLPAGSQIMSVPAPGKLPATFETSEQLHAIEGWNARTVAVNVKSSRPRLRGSSTYVRVNGVVTGIRPGMAVVVEGLDCQTNQPVQLVRTVIKVGAAASRAYTMISWNDPIDAQRADAYVMTVLSVTVLRDTAKLFGAGALQWKAVPDALKLRSGAHVRGGALRIDGSGEPVAYNSGLAMTPFFAVAVDENGTLWAGGDAGVYRSSSPYAGWTFAWQTVRRPYVRAVATHGGRVYAGTQRGEVYGSLDGGSSWYPVGAADAQTPLKAGMFAKLPPVVVRCFSVVDYGMGEKQRTFVVAGTDRGVFVTPDTAVPWRLESAGLPGSSDGSMSSATVFALATDGKKMYAATSAGLYAASMEASSAGLALKWSATAYAKAVSSVAVCGAGADQVVVFGSAQGVFAHDGGKTRLLLSEAGAISALCASQTAIVASGVNGLYRSLDGGKTWTLLGAPTFGQLNALACNTTCTAGVAPFDGFVEDQWPGWEISGSVLQLDATYPTLAASMPIALVQDTPKASLAARIEQIARLPQEGFGLRADVAVITIDRPIPQVNVFSRSAARVFWNAMNCDPYLETSAALVSSTPNQLTLAGTAPMLHQGRLLAVTGKHAGLKIVGRVGGVWKFADGTWVFAGQDERDTTALCAGADNALYAGFASGVQRFDGHTWQQTGEGLPDNDSVEALAFFNDALYAGTSAHGTFRFSQGNWECVDAAAGHVAALYAGANIALAATYAGLRYSEDGGATWFDALGLASGIAVYGLAASGDGFFAATGAGVYRSADGKQWTSLGVRLPNVDCRCVALLVDGTLFAGTAAGAFTLAKGAASWKLLRTGEIRAAAVMDGNLWYAVRGFGPYCGTQPVPIGAANDIRAFLQWNGAVYAASRSYSVFLAANGSGGFELNEPILSWIEGSFAADLDQGALSNALRSALAAIGVDVSPSAHISVAKRGESWSIEDGDTQIHFWRDSDGRISVHRDRVLEVMGLPQETTVKTMRLYLLQDQDGGLWTVTAASDQIELVSAAGTYENQVEVVELDAMTISEQSTTISFSPALAGCYDLATISVCGNVVRATHGERLAMDDVLGSGDARAQNQSFILHKPPITTLLAQDGTSFDRALEVRIRGNLPNEPAAAVQTLLTADATGARGNAYTVWREVDSFAGCLPSDRAYIAFEDENGVTTIEFGDGENGRRLPTGVENVTASYRSGSGPDGNLPSGSVSIMRSRPPGIRSITNVVPAAGGTAAEDPDVAARTAPCGTLALDRIVSLDDYAQYALSFPGIAKVATEIVPAQAGKTLVLTAAGPTSVPPDDTLVADLAQAIRAHRALDAPFTVVPFEPVYVRMAVSILIEKGADGDAVRADVLDALSDEASFESARFGRPLLAAALVAAAQDVAHVVDARVIALYRSGESPMADTAIYPREAHWSRSTGVLAAQLVFADERIDDAILVTVGEADA